MRIKKALLFIILVISISLLFHRHIIVTSIPETGIVEEVIDGDTIKLSNGRLVRYIGVDTPEVRSKKGKRWNYNPQPYSLESKRFNEQLVEGERIKIENDKEKIDKYGRVLGYVYPVVQNSTFKGKKGFLKKLQNSFDFLRDREKYKTGEMVNTQILKNGYGVIYVIPPNLKYIDKLVNVQKKAMEKRKGLWKKEVISPKEAEKYIGRAVVVRGIVNNMINKGKVVILKFKEKSNFVLVIFRSNLELFRKKKKLINEYINKVITAYGIVEDYKGTSQIVINHPCQLKILK